MRSKRWAGMSSACRRLTNKDSTKRCLPQRLWDSRRTLKWLLWYYNGLLKISFTVSQSCRILVKEVLCFQLFCGKAIHWVIGSCQRWRLYGNNFWYCSCYPGGFHLVSFKFANEHFLSCFISYSLKIRIKNRQRRDFPSGQWLRIFLPVQWTWVWSLVQELRSQEHALGPINCNYGAHLVQLPKPVCSRASALQKQKPAKPEARPLQPE